MLILKDVFLLLVVSISWNATITQAWKKKNHHILSGNYVLNHRHGASKDSSEIEKAITDVAKNILGAFTSEKETEVLILRV